MGEILRGLSESGALVFDEAAGRWSIDSSAGIALPESVREVIERRVERLGEESLEALRLAAVIGREFDLELLSAVVEIEETRLLDQLEAAMAASVLAESSEQVGRFRFVHALINQTLYEGLGATRRARMHQRVAQALEELYGSRPGRAPRRSSRCTGGWRPSSVDKAKAADYALRAGQRALESLAPAEALKLFTDAVELIGDADSRERCEALIGLGEAQRQTGDRQPTARRCWRPRASPRSCRTASSRRGPRWRTTGASGASIGEVDQERIAAIERALELDDPPHPGPPRAACSRSRRRS